MKSRTLFALLGTLDIAFSALMFIALFSLGCFGLFYIMNEMLAEGATAWARLRVFFLLAAWLAQPYFVLYIMIHSHSRGPGSDDFHARRSKFIRTLGASLAFFPAAYGLWRLFMMPARTEHPLVYAALIASAIAVDLAVLRSLFRKRELSGQPEGGIERTKGKVPPYLNPGWFNLVIMSLPLVFALPYIVAGKRDDQFQSVFLFAMVLVLAIGEIIAKTYYGRTTEKRSDTIL
jgi:hypothetical protein